MKYRIEYTETLGTEFEIDIPDDIPPEQAMEYADRHWETLIEPNIQTSELEVTGSDLDMQPAR